MRIIYNGLLAVVLLVCATSAPHAGQPGVHLEVVSTVSLPGGAEIVAVSPDERFAAVTQAGARAVRFVDLKKGKLLKKPRVDVSSIGEPTSVAYADARTVFVAVKHDPDLGTLVVADTKKGRILARVPIGIGPDSVHVDPTRKLAVVCIEDEETEVDDPFACPPENHRPGSIQIVDFTRGLSEGEISVATLPVDLAAVAGAGCPSDPQPEFVDIDVARGKAYVTVQENNAIAVVDLDARTVERVVSAGTTTHLADTTTDGVANVDDDFTGRREPDGLALAPDGSVFYTGDEGDTETSGGEYSGGRTVTVWDAASCSPIADTGDAIERQLAVAGRTGQSRPADRGPEPEGVVAFDLGGRRYVAVGAERSATLLLFDVTDAAHPAFEALAPVGSNPEGLAYVASRRLLLVANEVSTTLTILRIDPAP